MSWDNQQPPWGQKKGQKTPEEQIAEFLKKVKAFFDGGSKQGTGQKSGGSDDGGKGSGSSLPGLNVGLGAIGMIAGALLVVFLIASSLYTIQPGESGVVLRFGKYYTITNPGLNFKLPLFDQVIKVNTEAVRKEEFGFRSRVPNQRTQFQRQGFTEESLMLTSDRNVINVEWIVQYRVSDPMDFIFNVRNPQQAVRDIAEMTMRRIVGNMSFDFVLGNRQILSSVAHHEMQDVLNKYDSGLRILTVQLQDVNPPDAVKPAFNEVNEADQDMKRLVNEAETIYNREVPKARGQAMQVIEEAQGYAVARVNLAKGETSRFLAILAEYRKAKDVTRQRMYLETMIDVLPMVESVHVIDKDQRSILPFLDISGARKGNIAAQ